MKSFKGEVSGLLSNILLYIENINSQQIIDIIRFIIDISLVSYLVYKIIKVVNQTRAGQLIKGIVILLVATQLSGWLGLNTINFILRNTIELGVLALLIVFQPELRGALERLGRSKFGSVFNFEEDSYEVRMQKNIDEIVNATEDLSKSLIGGLIVIERETKLGDIAKTGTTLNAVISSELIKNIFFTHAPLHDGALIIGEGKIKAAGCILPLTENRSLSKDLGTRHRAALGVTENSDALVIIISEETGRISIACDGLLTKNLIPDTLRKSLGKMLFVEKQEKAKSIIWRGRNIWKRVE